jgi:hypothetical protein
VKTLNAAQEGNPTSCNVLQKLSRVYSQFIFIQLIGYKKSETVLNNFENQILLFCNQMTKNNS